MTALFRWPFAVIALVALVAGSSTLSAADQAKPNILIILADDLGRGEYSAFGTKDVRTPNIDRLFADGIGFDNFFANCCVCSPTRASIMTGCYPDRVGVPGVIRDVESNSWGYLSPQATLLPKVLKPAGYHSAIVGKWHLGLEPENSPNARGFDLFKGFLGDMMDDYFTHLRNGQNFMRENDQPTDPKGHATDVFTGWACDYLRSRAEAKEPFFLYLAYNAPHDPLQPRPDWLKKVQEREPRMTAKRQKLVGLIEHLDDGIGQVIRTLDETRLSSNTLVLFTSDNGGLLSNDANNGPWRGGKQMMYEGGLRVPFAARWPGHVRAGASAERRALSMDLFATACDAAGVAPPAGIDGVSFLPTLLSRPQAAAERTDYFVRREGGAAYDGKTIEALRKGDWKLVLNSPFAPAELFNLKDDPEEKKDLAAKDKARFQELSADLRLHIQQGGQAAWQKFGSVVKPSHDKEE